MPSLQKPRKTGKASAKRQAKPRQIPNYMMELWEAFKPSDRPSEGDWNAHFAGLLAAGIRRMVAADKEHCTNERLSTMLLVCTPEEREALADLVSKLLSGRVILQKIGYCDRHFAYAKPNIIDGGQPGQSIVRGDEWPAVLDEADEAAATEKMNMIRRIMYLPIDVFPALALAVDRLEDQADDATDAATE